MLLTKETVLRLLQEQGPLLPIQIKKELGGETIVVGAILSELLDDQSIKVSQTSFGSSPAYYIEGQKLDKLLRYLNPHQQKTVSLLQKKRVLEDKKQATEARIALRQLPDFAVSFEMKEKLYWKWHTVNEEQATRIAEKTRLKPKTKLKKTKKTKKQKQKKPKTSRPMNKKNRIRRKKKI